MGVVAILVMWPGPFEQTFCSPILRSLHIKIWVQLAQWFQRRICLKMLMDERRWTDAGVIGILLAHPWAISSGELKNIVANAFHKSNINNENYHYTKYMYAEFFSHPDKTAYSKYNSLACHTHSFNILVSLCSSTDWFEFYLVRNPKDRFLMSQPILPKQCTWMALIRLCK